MAENGGRNTESFALGIIVAAILFLLLRREFGARASRGIGVGFPGGAGAGAGAGSATPCCDACNGGNAAPATGPYTPPQTPSYNPGVSPGAVLGGYPVEEFAWSSGYGGAYSSVN